MTIFSCPFRIKRMTLLAATPTEVIPPITCSSVTIANRTGGDLRLMTDAVGMEYGIICDQFEERIDLSQSGSATALFHKDQICFYLRADMQGDVILTWT